MSNTLSLSIPLSGYSLESPSYYVQTAPFLTNIREDLDLNYRLIGYATTITTTYLLVLNIPIPIRKNSLNFANLTFRLQKTLPSTTELVSPFPEDDTPQLFIYPDIRQRDLDISSNDTFLLSYKTVLIENNIDTYSLLTSVNTSNELTTTVNRNNITNTLSITSFLQYHTTKPNWQLNNSISLIISGIPSGSGGVGALDLNSLALNLNYKVVPPDSPSVPSALESAYKQISLSWNPPSDNGGENISNYIIQSGSKANETQTINNWSFLAESVENNLLIDNLPVDKPISFRVAAKNSAGFGSFSLPSDSIRLSKNLAPITSLTFNDNILTRLRIRRALSSEWVQYNPILAIGEIAYELDKYRLKVGNGSSFWLDLPYVTIDQNSINFPPPPNIFLYIASSEFNLPSNDRIILNLSQNNRLNIIGKEGVTVNYDNDFKKLILSADKLYNPVSSGTLYNPTNSGVPGSLLYDSDWLYFCVANNSWNRSPIDKSWIDFASMTVSATNSTYSSNTSIIFDKKNFNISSNADPFPALAGRPLTNTQIRQFVGNQIVPRNLTFTLVFRGGTNTSNPMNISVDQIHGMMFNGTPIKPLTLGSGAIPGLGTPPGGFNYNAVFNNTKFSSDDCGGFPDNFGLYSYRDGTFLKNCWNTPEVYNSNSYYKDSSFSNDHFRHQDGHSKILGFCLDGYPIYGPYSYSDPMDKTSNTILMRSSYSGLATDNHRPLDWKYDNKLLTNDIVYDLFRGLFVEDFVYSPGFGTLDQFNGRFCITPEFPNGTYAYFLTFTNDSLTIPEFPYIFGLATKEQRINYV